MSVKFSWEPKSDFKNSGAEKSGDSFMWNKNYFGKQQATDAAEV